MIELTIDVGAGGWGLLVVGAFVIGVIAQWIGLAEGEDDWLPVMAGAFFGGVIGSECVAALATLEPVWDGIALVPAAIGGAFVGGIAALITVVVTGRRHQNEGHA